MSAEFQECLRKGRVKKFPGKFPALACKIVAK